MSQDLESMATSIFNNQVPAMWTNDGEGKGHLSLKPLASWIQDVNARIDFLQGWYDNGTPDVFWVSGFFFPQAFFTGTQQNFARKHTIAVDQISFAHVILRITHTDVKARPEAGCYVYGLYLEGCRWDTDAGQLGDSDPKKLFVDMPMLHFVPV